MKSQKTKEAGIFDFKVGAYLVLGSWLLEFYFHQLHAPQSNFTSMSG